MSNEFDIKKFRDLVKQGLFDQARQLLKNVFQKEPTNLEKGEFYVRATAAYLELMNAISRRQLMVLQEGIAALEDVDSVARNIHDDIALRKVEKKMKAKSL